MKSTPSTDQHLAALLDLRACGKSLDHATALQEIRRLPLARFHAVRTVYPRLNLTQLAAMACRHAENVPQPETT